MTTPKTTPAAAPIPIGGPGPSHAVPSPENFEGAVQHLIAGFLNTHSRDEEEMVGSLHRIFGSLAHELGRVDGAIRLHGVPRTETLNLLRASMLEGKAATLAQHEKNCSCEGSKVLQAEVEPN